MPWYRAVPYSVVDQDVDEGQVCYKAFIGWQKHNFPTPRYSTMSGAVSKAEWLIDQFVQPLNTLGWLVCSPKEEA